MDEFEHISLDGSKPRNASRGQVLKGQTEITFRKAAGSQTNIIIQGAQGPQRNDSLFRSDFNFEQMGIGGLDEQFKKMFRTAFASRIFPGIVKQLGADSLSVSMKVWSSLACGLTCYCTCMACRRHQSHPRYFTVRAARLWKDADRQTDREGFECEGAEDHQRTGGAR